MSDKPRFPNVVGMRVAAELCAALKPVTERLIVAGSLRRRKPDIGDVEILYIPVVAAGPDPDDMFASKMINRTDEVIAELERRGVLAKRTNVNGSTMFGPKNKLMLHRATGLPVDLFSATETNWFNYLVCRTGPADSNTRIAAEAQRKGWQWNPYGAGFTQGSQLYPVTSEEDVFNFVCLPFQPPHLRR